MEWIETDKRFPNDCKIVIVPGGLGYYSYAANKWFTIVHTERPAVIQWEVTHWMPFPDFSGQKKIKIKI